jgi:hypothetical protein
MKKIGCLAALVGALRGAAPALAMESSHAALVSMVYGHRRGIGASFYVGANFSRVRDPDAGVHTYQTEFFAKGSWTLDVL